MNISFLKFFSINSFQLINFSAVKKVSKGSYPHRNPTAWAKSLKGNSEVIGFNLKSIGNLFTDHKLKDLHIPNLDSARLRLFYANMLKKYCEINLGGPCVEPKGCNIKDVCPDDKLCVNDEDESTGFRCEDNIVTIPTDSCRLGSLHFFLYFFLIIQYQYLFEFIF